MQIFSERTNRQYIPILKEMPSCVEIHQGFPGILHFCSGEDAQIGCLGCINPRCMVFSNDEINCDRVTNFPSDRLNNVCPVEAIAWNKIDATPNINTDKCISCGICVERCPVGALYFSDDGELLLNNSGEEYFEYKSLNTTTKREHNIQIERLSSLPRGGVSLNASDDLFERIYKKLSYLNSRYHNVVGRNLLIALGCNCSMRRTGDVYTRMDAIYTSPEGTFGAVEIEFGNDTLDAARGILDDIAILNSRYGINKNDNKAIVISLKLPNARQGYWQVVKDVKTVEGIKIETITIGALMFLLWNRCKFEPEDDRYYIDYDNMNLRQILCVQTDYDRIPVSEKHLGIMEPEK